MNKVMQQIDSQFPERTRCIRQLWAADEDFRDLCRDYALCLEMLAHWPDEMPSQARRSEYVSLRRRLELEIDMKTQTVQSEEPGR